jgi:hypothetical protein
VARLNDTHDVAFFSKLKATQLAKDLRSILTGVSFSKLVSCSIVKSIRSNDFRFQRKDMLDGFAEGSSKS